MGLFFAEQAGDFQARSETAVLQQLGCKACPLQTRPGRMEPTGSNKPVIYMCGEAPGKTEVEQGKQFVGVSGQVLRELIPKGWEKDLRWNNTVRSNPANNETPSREAIECCRPSIVLDIEQTKPRAIFGFGNTPLHWVSGFSGITLWRGRRMPVKVGNHTCWFYAFQHPASFLHQRRPTDDGYLSEEHRMLEFDLRRAFAEVEHLPMPVVHTPEMARVGVECVTNIRQIEKALQWASRQSYVGVDYETNCLRPYQKDAAILSAAVGTLERAFAFPMFHPGAGYGRTEIEDVLDLWKRFLLSAPCRKIVHNLAFEQEWSGYFFGTETLRARPWEDTANAAAIIDERRGKQKPGCFSLEFLVQQYFGFNVKKVSNVDRQRLTQTPLETVLTYNGIDAKYHAGLWEKQWEVIKQEGLEEAYELAVRRVPTVTLSQLKGTPVDQTRVKQLQKKYGALVEKAETTIAKLPIVKEFERKKGKPFNPYSGPDVIYVFDKMLRRPEVMVVDKYSKKERKSADESVLSQIDHPLADAVLDLRSYSGTKSKYIDALLEGSENSVLHPDGLAHTQYNTFFSEGGRLSSEEPNLQNFPMRDEKTKEVRSSIVAERGCGVLKFDYGQIEARVLAMITNDKRFCQALWENHDVHLAWAERIAYDYPARIGGKKNLTDKKVMKDFRTDIKNQWTFPLFFGAKVESAAGYLKIPTHIVRPHYNAFWKEFAGVKAWQEQLLKFYQEYGYVSCLTGRRRRGPLTTNQIFNSPVQGTAAEIVLDAMSRLSETGDPELQPEVNIHDDLTFLRVPEKRVDVVAEKIIGHMLAVPFPWINVPISVEMSYGKNWAGLEEIGTYSSHEWKK